MCWDNVLVRLKGFQKLTSTDDALQKWFSMLQVKKPDFITVPLSDALNRVLAEDVTAADSLPRFDRSAVDGYALNAEATTGASQFKPTLLQLTQSNVVGSEQAKQVWTGNPIPKGADAVVMIENTQKRDERIEVWVQLAPGDNVSKKGEDLKKGEVAAKTGTRLNPYHLGLLAALGKNLVFVTKKPRIAILATGNELAEVGSEPAENQIFESNRIMLSAMCRELDAEPLDLGIARDDLDEIAEKIRNGLRNADAVITTGGTSVGGLDLVPDAVNKLGKPGIVIHGLAMRPGMPTALAMVDGKPVMVLSGNPVAAVVGFEVFARPLICRMLGMKEEEPRPTVKAVMTRRVSAALGRKTFVRVKAYEKNGEFFAEPVSARGSGAISTMTRGNGFVIVPENREGLTEGELVAVRLFANVEVAEGDV
jgi:molybdopterin molybdotransferase